MFGEDVWPKQVGYRYLPNEKVLSYADVYNSRESKDHFSRWIDPNRYLPYPCDLVSLKFEHKISTGWWNGYKWVGLRIRSESLPTSWKRIVQAHDVIDYRMERVKKEEKLRKRFAHFK